MTNKAREDLEHDLKDPEFVKFYGAAQAKDEIAVTLAKARLEHGLTQQELANKLGYSQPYIAKLERGDANPTVGTVGSILALLGLRLVTNTEALVPHYAKPASFRPTTSGESSPPILQAFNDVAQGAWGHPIAPSATTNAGFMVEAGTASANIVLGGSSHESI